MLILGKSIEGNPRKKSELKEAVRMGVGDRTLTSEVGSRVEARWEQLLWGGSLGAWGG